MSELVRVNDIEAVLFDMNGTLRVREPHPETQQNAIARLLQLLDKQDSDELNWDDLNRRHKAYSCWAQENLTQLSEAEIWTEWLLPEIPRAKIEPVAAELMLAWGERKGRVTPRPGADETIRTLKQRGYHLGVISNSTSTLDIPRSLENFGWKDVFEVVVLSSILKIRKPDPEPYLVAARSLGIAPDKCAYIGNRTVKDIPGCRRAGYALAIVLEPEGGVTPWESADPIHPDRVIHSLPELLALFPPRKG